MARSNEDKWVYFLSSIDTNTLSDLPTNNLSITTKRNIGGLATEFANKLLQNKGGTVVLTGKPDVLNRYKHLDPSINQQETTNTRANIPPVETLSQIEIPVDKISLVKDDVNIVRKRVRNKPTPSTTKPDMDKSCSIWSISNIAKYFSFDNCVTRIEMPTSFTPYPEHIYEMVQNDIHCRSKIVRGIDLEEITFNSNFLGQMISITSIEAGSRLVVDALLVPLCSELGLQFEVEKSIDYNFLPYCRFDYCIRKEQHIIGCIETKSVKTLSDKSVAQAVLQLIVLQTTLMETETPTVDISSSSPFAIVTDGHRFIYMQLIGSSLGFEHDGDQLRIRKVENEGDFKDILNHIRFLVQNN
jgi:hypothetical protein